MNPLRTESAPDTNQAESNEASVMVLRLLR